MLASAAGVTFLLLTLAIVYSQKTKVLVRFIKPLILPGIIVFTVLFSIPSVRNFTTVYLNYVKGKVLLTDNNESSVERIKKVSLAVQNWIEAPFFGKGPGYGVEEYKTGYYNTYLTVLSDTGLFTFLLLNGFLIIIIFKAYALKDNIRHYLLLAMVYLLIHSSICVLYYHFIYFLPIVLTQVIYTSVSQKLKSNEALAV